jgi:acetylornithine deacetylase/succinyl-diaminopimelate desuccinylase-like protein
MNRLAWVALACTAIALGQTGESAADLAARYLPELIRLDTTNPPGNETRVARYLKQVADREGIPAELLGDDPERLNFVARLRGNGKQRPLLLIAHSDVVPFDRSQWSVDPLAGIEKNGYVYGRGAEDDKQLLAAELAVMVDLHRRKVVLDRDIILLSESDEEAGSLGATWMVQHAWAKIDAEFALNEYSYILPTPSGVPVFQIQTAEKVPTRFIMTARGTTDGAYLRAKGMAVYGVPLFRKDGDLRMHGNDERMSLDNLRSGTDLLRKIVIEVAKP